MTPPAPRLASLDQFRGLAVVAMLFVNFGWRYPVTPGLFRHLELSFTFADAIMPMFFFAVGFATRMVFLKRVATVGRKAAFKKIIVRSLGLILLGCVVYRLSSEWTNWDEMKSQSPGAFLIRTFKGSPFQTLVHIGLTSLFVLPVIHARPAVRVAYLVLSGISFASINVAGYYSWNQAAPRGIEGGPLGFLSWTIPLLIGTLTFDAVARGVSTLRLALAGVLIAALAVAIMAIGNPAATWPFGRYDAATAATANAFTMSANGATVTLTTFGAGFALLVFAAFRRLTDEMKIGILLFDLFGRNALATYVIHEMVRLFVSAFVPTDSPLWYVLFGLTFYLGMIWLFVRHLDRKQLYLTL